MMGGGTVAAAEMIRSPLYVSSELLSAVQLARVFPDSKTFVDMPLRESSSPDAVAAAFKALPRDHRNAVAKDVLASFLAEHFAPAGSDIQTVTLPDFTPSPAIDTFLPKVHDPGWRDFALSVHKLWPLLGRRSAVDEGEEWVVVDNDGGERVAASGGGGDRRHSLIALPSPMIVPGDRFRETYYWDSYWIVRGLLISRMPITARGVLSNLLSVVRQYGFVPNGSRVYYLNRSQPPLLSSTVLEYYQYTDDIDLVREALPLLQEEYAYWTRGKKLVRVEQGGRVHELSRYYAETDLPRPESYYEDETATAGMGESETRELHRELATVAESGWDFSSRWRGVHLDAATTRITCVVPVDLNVFLLRMERDIHALLGAAVTPGSHNHDKEQAYYLARAQAREDAINSVLWDPEHSRWRDLWLPLDGENNYAGVTTPFEACLRHPSGGVYASDFTPSWCGLVPPASDKAGLAVDQMDTLLCSGLVHAGGITVSDVESGEQWDFPNAWPPIQCILIESLMSNKRLRPVAKNLAHAFLSSCRLAYEATGAMHEKYDARVVGDVGGGGEYVPQVGFGWTNAVTLVLLHVCGAPAQP
eukprot:jgi/Chlat1/5911/Chrsp4S06406